jgi:hypothetical protein
MIKALAIAAALGMSIPFPACAQVAGDTTAEVDRLASNLAIYQANLSAARTKLDNVKAQIAVGTLRTTEISPAEAELKIAEVQYEQAKKDLTRLQGAQSLTRPVDVNLKEATVRQAAEVLSKVSNVPIEVDKAVSDNLRITVSATSIPLATVLEVVADQAKLQIGKAPSGVVLRTWPRLEVNGTRTDYTGPNAPWSDEWASPYTTAIRGQTSGARWQNFLPRNTLPYSTAKPTQSLMNTLNAYSQTAKANPKSTTNYRGALNTLSSPQATNRALTTWTAAPATTAMLNITGVGDRLVVAEAGVGPKGEAGYWLTVYRLSGSELVRVASTFHVSPAKPARGATLGYGDLFYNRTGTTWQAIPKYPLPMGLFKSRKPAKR